MNDSLFISILVLTESMQLILFGNTGNVEGMRSPVLEMLKMTPAVTNFFSRIMLSSENRNVILDSKRNIT